MNNRRALGITFAILGIICVVIAAIHLINDSLKDSITLLLAYVTFGVLFFITGKTLLTSSTSKTLQSYR